MFLDIVAVLCLVLTFLPAELKFGLALYLIIKGVLFGLSGDKLSWVDTLAGLYLGLIAFGYSYWLITFIFVIYLAQKVVISFFSV